MKNISIIKIAIALVSLLTLSCKQEVVTDIKKISVESLILNKQKNPLLNNPKALLSFTSSGFFNSPVNDYTVNGYFGKGSNIKSIGVDGIVIDSYDGDGGFAHNDTQRKLAALSGKEVSIEINPNSSQPSARGNSFMLMPAYISVHGSPSSPGPGEGLDPRRYRLTWTPNGLNQKVYVLISFDKDAALNKDFWSYNTVEKFIEVNDNEGGYLLTGGDFQGIPNKGFTNIIVARGGVALLGGTSTQSGGTVVTTISTAELMGHF
jgi:hypothetical protein